MLSFFCLGLLILAAGPIARTFATQTPALINRVPLPSLGECRSLHGWSAAWTPTFVDPDYAIAESYQCDGYKVHVNVVQYVDQYQGKEAVGEFNSVIPRSWWNATTRSRQVVTSDLEVDEYKVERSFARLTIWNWYAVGLRPTSSIFEVKALEALNALRLRSRATTNLTVAVEADPGFDATPVLKKDAGYFWTWFNSEMRTKG